MDCAACNKPWNPTGHWCIDRGAEAPSIDADAMLAEMDGLRRRASYLEGALVNATNFYDAAIRDLSFRVTALTGTRR